MRWVIGMEHSGVIREAFRALGVEAYSCDLLPSDDDSEFHLQGDIFEVMEYGGFTHAIFHPDCTYLTCSGEKWYRDDAFKFNPKPTTLWGGARRAARDEALRLVERLACLNLEHFMIENPVGVINSRIPKMAEFDFQVIQPYQFGHNVSKSTCLWRKGLPELKGTKYVAPVLVNGRPRWGNQSPSGADKTAPGPDRWKTRSKTYKGVAKAIAQQYGTL